MTTATAGTWGGDAALQLAMEAEAVGRDFYDALAGLLEESHAASVNAGRNLNHYRRSKTEPLQSPCSACMSSLPFPFRR